MTTPDALAEFTAENARAERPSHPSGWEPGIAWDGRKGTITSRPLAEPGPDWRNLLETWGFDPETVEVVEPVQVRTWDAAVGDGQVRTMWYYRAGIQQKRQRTADVDELVALVKRRKPVKPAATPDGMTYVVGLSDWQLGKRGTATTIERIAAAIDTAADRLTWLRRRYPVSTVALPCLGDLGEACDGHYAMQSFEVELDGRQQARLGRRLLLHAIDRFLPMAERIIVPAVPGNHGEKRKDGKAFTTFGDNVDLEIPEGVAEACRMSRAYDAVSFVIPDNDLTLTLDLSGCIVGFAHGHQAKYGGSTSEQRMASWWSGQAFGMRPVGDATLLFTGHSHHFSAVEHGPRTHLQSPAMDNGSQWWDETAGLPARAGMLTCLVDGRGWHEIEVI